MTHQHSYSSHTEISPWWSNLNLKHVYYNNIHRTFSPPLNPKHEISLHAYKWFVMKFIAFPLIFLFFTFLSHYSGLHIFFFEDSPTHLIYCMATRIFYVPSREYFMTKTNTYNFCHLKKTHKTFEIKYLHFWHYYQVALYSEELSNYMNTNKY